MLYKTHAAGGFAAGLIITGNPLLGAIAKVPVVSHGNKMIFGHRQVFHSLVGTLAFFLVSLLIVKSFHLPAQYAYAALIGYVSHLVLDSFNPAGVPWLWPLKFRLKIPITEPGGFIERIIILPSVILLAVIVLGKHVLPFLFQFGRGVRFL